MSATGTIKAVEVDAQGRGALTVNIPTVGDTELKSVPKLTKAALYGKNSPVGALKPGNIVQVKYNDATLVALNVLVVGQAVDSPKVKASPPDADRAKEIKARLAKLRAEAATLEGELAKLELGDIKPGSAAPRLMKLGRVVQLLVSPNNVAGDLMVREVVDDKTLVVHWRDDNVDFMVRGRSTKGIADRQAVEIDGVWRVTDTVRHLGSTMFVVEPLGSPPPKK